MHSSTGVTEAAEEQVPAQCYSPDFRAAMPMLIAAAKATRSKQSASCITLSPQLQSGVHTTRNRKQVDGSATHVTYQSAGSERMMCRVPLHLVASHQSRWCDHQAHTPLQTYGPSGTVDFVPPTSCAAELKRLPPHVCCKQLPCSANKPT